jgi:hypothetical protein
MSYKAPVISVNDFGTAKVGTGLVVNNGIISAIDIPTNSYYGQFYSSNTQTNAAANTVNKVSFPITLLNNGITTSGTDITFANSGVYKIIYELQAETTSGGGGNINVWLAVNGVDLPNSNSISTLDGGGDDLIVNRSYLVNVTAGQSIRVLWSSSVSSMRLLATGTQVGPTRPSSNSANFLATLVRAL